MSSIGIIGGGTAGLHLGLRLLMHGIPVTLYVDRDPAEWRSARLLNTVAHSAQTRARERALGVNHWDTPDLATSTVGFFVGGPQPFGFRGKLEEASIWVDYRLYYPRLSEDFVARGGHIEVSAVDAAGLERLAQKHSLVVVASGRAGLTQLFPRIPEFSPHTRPQRLLFAGLFHGIRPSEPLGMQLNVTEHGEIVEGRMISAHGSTGSLLLEAIPGGPLESICTQRWDANPSGLESHLLELLRKYAPVTYERVDPAAFKLTGPMDWLQGGFTPVVRKGYAALGGGRFVMAVGDAHVLNDPAAGQGANAAVASAWLLAESIHETLSAGKPFDEAFCQRTEARAWETLSIFTAWSNGMLQPPPPFVGQALFMASQDQRLADAVINTLTKPERAVHTFASPESVAAFVARYSSSLSS